MRALVWFSQDLRVFDNPTLNKAHSAADSVLHVAFLGDLLRPSSMPGLKGVSSNRKQFLYDAIASLKAQLELNGHSLLVINGRACDELGGLIANYSIDAVFAAQQAAFDETQLWAFFDKAYKQVNFHLVSSNTLFEEQTLPFSVAEMPKQFTPFRKKLELSKILPREQKRAIPWSDAINFQDPRIATQINSLATPDRFSGGELAAVAHLNAYFNSKAPLTYKKTRNALQGFDSSTKFSPWLAQGSLSAISIVDALREYERKHGANESTYWIFFELLWREFFFWSARQTGEKLFWKKGRRATAPLTSFYPERFQAWVNGSTPWPLVNACMNELAETGFLSNRGRQVVASCLVNELQLDWRYGAAYFEQQLIDYDAASNWGNWQYLAGIGADPRGQRQFNIQKQTDMYDPSGEYIRLWHGADSLQNVDSRDAADWPILPTKLDAVTRFGPLE